MTKNYLKKFIKYVKKAYHIEDALKALTDGRKNPLYTTAEAVAFVKRKVYHPTSQKVYHLN